ncbi:class I SAM-dependent DNA methyltransferase [Streptomyces enissocaesilis]|uniref:Class I SAM-dependent methyltransferase n=1 Tax=Streptomyces enissocaesilis TaxID=332589 RepID=A0ABP6JUY2_9ACTN
MSLLRDADLSAAFDHAARTYDRMTSANPGYHRHLRRSARRLGLPAAGRGLRLLDLGCGTGASTAALLRAAPLAGITAVDASAGMLERARAKPWPPGVSFVHSPVELLEEAGVHGPFDAVFAAYLFRNVDDPDQVLAAVRSALAPGGRIAVHEYTLSGRAADRAVWTAVCKALVMPLGRRHGDTALYDHLWRSVVAFDTADAFAARLRGTGFAGVRTLPLPGWQTGITHTFVAHTPGTARPGTTEPGTTEEDA